MRCLSSMRRIILSSSNQSPNFTSYRYATERSISWYRAMASKTAKAAVKSKQPAATAASCWKGHVIARLLPVNMNKDYEHQCKPVARQLDPSTLKEGAGAAMRRRQRPSCVNVSAALPNDSKELFLNNMQSNNAKGQDASGPDNNNNNEDVVPLTSADQVTTLGIYLYKDTPSTNDKKDDTTIVIQMQRQTDELVAKTLKRMELSIAKKLYPTRHKPASGSHSTDPTVNNNSPKLSIVDFETGALLEQLPTGGARTNRHVWTDAAAATAATNTNNTHMAITIPRLDNLVLQVESCPPTIAAVETFGHFEASQLFVNVPVQVTVTCMMYSNSTTTTTDTAVIDWYVDGTLVKADSAVFVPRQEHVDQNVAVLITPIRKESSSSHGGGTTTTTIAGCEEAYSFVQTVQPLPDNTLLRLRPSFTALRDSTDNDSTTTTTTTTTTNTDLRVVTYNILADQNAFSSTNNKMPVYPYCPKEFLNKYRRMPLILHELLAYQADIMCLQEVDESVFESLFEPLLKSYGYTGYYSCKASEGNREGCAVFWRTERFGPVPVEDRATLVLRDLFPLLGTSTTNGDGDGDDEHENAHTKDRNDTIDDEWTSTKDLAALIQERPDLSHILATRLGHVAQVVPLTCLQTGRRIVVTNTHLFYHPMASHVRLMQLYFLCRHVGRQQLGVDEHYPPAETTSLILCGDLNTSLTNSAGKLLVDRHVPSNHRDLQTHLNQFEWRQRGTTSTIPAPPTAANVNEDSNIHKQALQDFPAVSLPDSFPLLTSALQEPPSFTHYIVGFFGTLDHVLHSPGLVTARTAAMPSVRNVARNTAMPSELLPSDHVSLVCDLSIVDR